MAKSYYHGFKETSLRELWFGGKKYVVKDGFEDPRRLSLDAANPRLASAIAERTNGKGLKNPTDDDVAPILLESADIRPLRDAMKSNGAPLDALEVDASGRVREGSRRYLGSLELHLEGDPRFKIVPVSVFPPEFGEMEWRAYLNIIHVAQKRPWEAVDRAESLCKQIENGHTEQQVARANCWTDTKIKITRRAYEEITQYRKKYKDFRPAEWTKFLKFARIFRNGNPPCIPESNAKMSHAEVEAISQWFQHLVSEGKVRDCRHVEVLHELYYNSTARKLAARYDTRKAYEYMRGQAGNNTPSKDPIVVPAERLDGELRRRLELKPGDPSSITSMVEKKRAIHEKSIEQLCILKRTIDKFIAEYSRRERLAKEAEDAA
jgi:hypothetical protein